MIRVFINRLLILALFMLTMNISAGEVLFTTFFKDGAEGWLSSGNTSVSDVSRRDNGHSLCIKQHEDKDAVKNCWLSPAIKNPGKTVYITFWAAENYRLCPDYSYSAGLNVISLDENGKITGETVGLMPITWDEERHDDSSLWGVRLTEGLVWKYYEVYYKPSGVSFQISFGWPKPMARGDIYITDIEVSTSEIDTAKARSLKIMEEKRVTPQVILELSTPVNGNLFLDSDPLQFEVLIYSGDGKPLRLPSSHFLEYKITDYQNFFIANGRFDFKEAMPVSIEGFYESRAGMIRKENLHLPVKVENISAREPGRLFFMEMSLMTEKREVLASDTITYGVVQPRDIPRDDYQHARFIGGYFNQSFYPAWRKDMDDSISGKQGILLYHQLDYGWRHAQPVYPGPYNFGEKRSSHPKLFFLPNIEQIRGRPDSHPYGGIPTYVPDGAVIPDPLRPGRNTFKIDPYVEYIVNYIRHNREGISMVIPSGLERRIDDRTIELQKKAYTAIKKEFSDLPVGFMLYGLSEEEINRFLEEKIYEYCDFIGDHFYRPSIDWTQWKRLQGFYKKKGLSPVPLVSTEFSRVGGMDQVQRSRDMITSHLESFANGLEKIYYYNTNNSPPRPEPFLRGATDLGGSMNSGFLYLQRVLRPRVSKEIVCPEPASRWRTGSSRLEYGGESLMPILQTMTYYNLVQNFELSGYRETLRPDANSIVYLFDRDDATVAAGWLINPVGNVTYLVSTEKPFTVQDIYGREVRIVPHEGRALLTIDENPLVITFDKPGEKFSLVPLSAKMQSINVVRGQKGEAEVTIPDIWREMQEIKITFTVDGHWPDIKPVKISVDRGKDAVIKVPFTVNEKRPLGEYTLTAGLSSKNGQFGFLRTPMHVTESLQVNVEGLPVTINREPAVKVEIHNYSKNVNEGVVHFDNRYFATGMRNERMEKPYRVTAGKSVSIEFPVIRETVNLSKSYKIEVEVNDSKGINIKKREEVSFRGVPRKGKEPIEIDGDLSDWKTEHLVPVNFARAVGNNTPDENDISGSFYALWDDENLYFAVQLRDDSSVIRSNDVGIWQDDNIMLGLHPWGWKMGETVMSGYYREHLGLCKDGTARIFRVGAVPGGPEVPDGARLAVNKTKDGYVYEWSYSGKDIHPLLLKEGGRFRLSLFALDRDWIDREKKATGTLKGIQFGGFNTNVDARPEKWCEFVLVK